MKRLQILLMLGLFLILSSTIWGAVPQLINFQGILRDGSGNPVANGSYSVVFSIYDALSGGTMYWSETQTVVTTSGLFNVNLGSVNPLGNVFIVTTYLGIKVGADPEMSPRTTLVSVPYSYRTGSVDLASGGYISSKVSIGPGCTNFGLNAFAAGEDNTASGDRSTVCGFSNMASGDRSTVGGGWSNTASGTNATVGGGSINTAGASSATVGGGNGNSASGDGAAVGGGAVNTASGLRSTIPGGSFNTAAGDYSFAAGKQAKANHNGTFVWGDNSTFVDFISTAPDQFLIRAVGGVGIGTNSPAAGLHVKGAGFPQSFGYFDTDAGSQDAGLRFYEAGTVKSHVYHQASTNTLNLYGEGFSGISVTSTGNVGIGTAAPTQKLHVAGNICATGTIGACSDARYKANLRGIPDALGKLEKLRGVFFTWNRDEFPQLDFEDGNQIGFVAQELKKVLPEAVSQGGDGFYSVDYGRLTPLLVEAIKEQQKQIEELKDEIAKLKNQPHQVQVENQTQKEEQ